MDGQWDRLNKRYKASQPRLPDRTMLYEDGGERYTMREFLDQHQFNLPKIIIVTQGFEGDAELDTLSCGLVMRIACVCKQKRAVAKDESGRTITIPLDYPLLFRPTKQKKKNVKGQRLGEILGENSLPLEVEFCCSEDFQLDVGRVQALVRSFGKITVSSVYNESYCLANCIFNGFLAVHTILIPLYLKKVLVSTVTRIKGRNYDQFVQFQRNIETTAKEIIYDGKSGNENIAIYNQTDIGESKVQTLYDNLEPERFFRFTKSQEKKPEEYSKLQFPSDEIPQPVETFNTGETTTEKRFGQQLQSKSNGRTNYSTLPLPPPPEPKPDYILQDSVPKVPPRVPLNLQMFPQIKKKGDRPPYVNNIARAVVSPFETHASRRDSFASRSDSFASRSDSFASRSDSYASRRDSYASADMAGGLTIDQLGDKLRALKLGKYVESFSKEKIDGDLLGELSEDVLKEEFKFSTFEAIKLMTFVRTGHIPH